MSISGALSNALAGLTATSRAAEVVSSNLSNVMNENYARRDLAVSSRASAGLGGLRVLGVTRFVDQGLLADRRFADGEYSNVATTTKFKERLEGIVGTPEDAYSLSARMAEFESGLISAASRPDSNERLENVFLKARDLAESINSVSNGIQKLRVEAEREIKTVTDRVNVALEQVRELNYKISAAKNQGSETVALEDHRQEIINEISEYIPVREVPRDRGTVALYTTGGAILLDGSAAKLEFSAGNGIMPHMTVESGLLSGLTVNGIAVRTDSATSPIRGGRLAALFEVRDELAIVAQSQVDGVARDLVERFQDAGLDPSRIPGSAGLFTDGGAAFDPLDLVGLSGRLEINAAVDPAAGGGTWRLRDGLGTATSGPIGDATLLQAMSQAMTQLRTPVSGGFGAAARTASGLADSFASAVGITRHVGEQNLSFATTRLTELKTMELENGVDSDYEMQRLMLIEQAYSANARVIETVDQMIQTLLRL